MIDFAVEVGSALKSWAWLMILLVLIGEVVVILGVNRGYHWEIVPPGEQVDEKAAEFRGYALTLAGLAFASIALLVSLGSNPVEFRDVFNVLAVAIALFFVSYEVKELVRTRRFWLILQEKTLGYGFLTLFAAVVILYYDSVDSGTGLMLLVVFGLVASIRYYTVYRQLEMYQDMKATGEYDKGHNEQIEDAEGESGVN